MNLQGNKKFIVVGVVVLAIAGYYFYNKKRTKPLMQSALPPDTTVSIRDNYTVTLGSVDPTGAVYVILGGKKYGFPNDKAFISYGYTKPETITKAELDLIPSGGFISDEGKVIKNS